MSAKKNEILVHLAPEATIAGARALHGQLVGALREHPNVRVVTAGLERADASLIQILIAAGASARAQGKSLAVEPSSILDSLLAAAGCTL